jgi:hypothetical protein
MKYFKIALVIMLVFYLGYCGNEANKVAMQEKTALENAAKLKEKQEAREATLSKIFVERLEKQETAFMENVISLCKSGVSDSSIFNLSIDRRDPINVERLLKNLNVYDTEAKIKYLNLPELGETEFSDLIGKRTLSTWNSIHRTEVRFAVTYDQDSFSGLLKAWAILICPIKGEMPSEITLERLYIE